MGGLKILQDLILDEVVDTPGSYADYYNAGAGVPFGLVSFHTIAYLLETLKQVLTSYVCTSPTLLAAAGSKTRAEEALAMTMAASSVAEEAAATIATEAEEAGSATAEAGEARRQSPPDSDGSRRKTLGQLRTSRPWVAERTARISVFWRPSSQRRRLCYRLLLLEHICA